MKPGMPCASTMDTMPPMPPRNLAIPCSSTNAPNTTRRISRPRSFWVFWFMTPPVEFPSPSICGGGACCRVSRSPQGQLQGAPVPVEHHPVGDDVGDDERAEVVADAQARAVDDHEALRGHLVPHVHAEFQGRELLAVFGPQIGYAQGVVGCGRGGRRRCGFRE